MCVTVHMVVSYEQEQINKNKAVFKTWDNSDSRDALNWLTKILLTKCDNIVLWL